MDLTLLSAAGGGGGDLPLKKKCFCPFTEMKLHTGINGNNYFFHVGDMTS